MYAGYSAKDRRVRRALTKMQGHMRMGAKGFAAVVLVVAVLDKAGAGRHCVYVKPRELALAADGSP